MPKVLEKFKALPRDVNEFMNWSWDQIKSFYVDLAERALNIDTVDSWLRDWSRLSALLDEALQRQYVATTRYTADKSIQDRLEQFNHNVYLAAQSMDQQLKQKLINSQLCPPGFEIALRNMVADAALFRETICHSWPKNRNYWPNIIRFMDHKPSNGMERSCHLCRFHRCCRLRSRVSVKKPGG